MVILPWGYLTALEVSLTADLNWEDWVSLKEGVVAEEGGT